MIDKLDNASVRCSSGVLYQEQNTCIYIGTKYLCILLWLYGFNKLVKHLKYNNILFKYFLSISYFMQDSYT
jgi:hypothetical protein